MSAMLISYFTGRPRAKFVGSGSRELDLPSESIDVLTAIMSHHYFDIVDRRKATENCFRMLNLCGRNDKREPNERRQQ